MSSPLLIFQVKWRGLIIRFDNVDPHIATVGAIKAALEEKTGVAPMDQKLIGMGVKLTNATAQDGNVKLCDIPLKSKNGIVAITLMGTPQVELIEQQAKEFEQLSFQNKQVLNDLNFGNLTPATREWKKLHDFSMKVEMQFLTPPRPGKKLLILDLDHTLMHFDSKDEGAGTAPNPNSNILNQNHNTYVSTHNDAFCNTMKRPYMDYFLTSVYPYYDIAIWSQTHWKWIEIKLTELGIIPNRGYKICFILDKSSMFKIPPSGYVKPIHIIWSKFGNIWNKSNTVHVDDMERNFVLNKQTGILCTPFYRLGYNNSKNDILTSTLSNTAYGPKGLILSAISTTSMNYYYHRQSYSMEISTNSINSSFPAPGSSGSTAFPAPGIADININSNNNGSNTGLLSDDSVLPPIGSAQYHANAAAYTNSVMANVNDTNKHQGQGQGPDNVVPRGHYTLGSPEFVHPTRTTVAAHPSNVIASNSSHDVELYFLSRYLCNLAHVEDLSSINHAHWRLHSHTVVPAAPTADVSCSTTGPNRSSAPVVPSLALGGVSLSGAAPAGPQSARTPEGPKQGHVTLLSHSVPGSKLGTPRSGSTPVNGTPSGTPRSMSPLAGRVVTLASSSPSSPSPGVAASGTSVELAITGSATGRSTSIRGRAAPLAPHITAPTLAKLPSLPPNKERQQFVDATDSLEISPSRAPGSAATSSPSDRAGSCMSASSKSKSVNRNGSTGNGT